MSFNKSVLFPDISFYQDDNNTPAPVDFAKMKAAGAVGVIIRAGQRTWIDPDFRLNWRLAKEAGLPRGTYWFYDSREAPTNQARLFLEIVGDDLPEMGYWLDLEEVYGGTYRGWQNWKSCLRALRENREDVGIYTAPAYWKQNRPTDPNELSYFGTFPLWIANYGVSQPAIPAPWTVDKCWFWQFAVVTNGGDYGVESKELDMNCWNGTAEEFYAKFGGVVPPPIGETEMITGTALVNVNLRDAPAGAVTGAYLAAGDKIEADRHEFQWLHITKINGVAVSREYWASAGTSQQYIQWEEVTTPPPPAERKITKGVLYFDDGTSVELFPNP